KPPLSMIGGKKWKTQKAKVTDSVHDLASEMLRVRAAREHMSGFVCKSDSTWMSEFEAEFPYDETEDQLAALIEIKKDMCSTSPMDRLICGDVGFGKTELAIRAAFRAVESGKQVAVLVPTTVLAEQHEQSFRQRFADYPFTVASLSRFKTTKEIKQTLKDVQLGRVDILIGTHRILSKDVHFADLGLVVIDEEQRFGVEHKERLLQLRLSVHVLTLSATPIPRTLHMSMLGLRDISSLTTPPVDRRAVVTEVIPYNTQRIQRAIQRELAREGQVYFVHNRVHNIESVADKIAELAPGAEIVIGHGQMNPHDLEGVMVKFMKRRADILVCTTIIESGIDNPTANTMIINDADRFGLSDLHQLRGRVGRSHHRAYCYMLLPEDRTVKEAAQKRLKAIEQYSMLGAGFKIAMRDLEIRGAGNLLGSEQSGHIAAVGYEMYCQLLDDAVRKLTDTDGPKPVGHTVIDIGLFGLIPKMYIPSDARRLEAYRRIAGASTLKQLDQVVDDITSAYSAPPELARRLILRARVRAVAQAMHIRVVGIRDHDIVCLTANPQILARAMDKAAASVRVVNADIAQTNARSASGEALAEVYIRPKTHWRSEVQLAKQLVDWFAGGS
ncbi:MAG: DEAD/DEAH box helicase, partial [Phycisphaerales bacterium]|nr:DEAD/DEAH box helicase [Phycisphaerales bacterium]